MDDPSLGGPPALGDDFFDFEEGYGGAEAGGLDMSTAGAIDVDLLDNGETTAEIGGGLGPDSPDAIDPHDEAWLEDDDDDDADMGGATATTGYTGTASTTHDDPHADSGWDVADASAATTNAQAPSTSAAAAGVPPASSSRSSCGAAASSGDVVAAGVKRRLEEGAGAASNGVNIMEPGYTAAQDAAFEALFSAEGADEEAKAAEPAAKRRRKAADKATSSRRADKDAGAAVKPTEKERSLTEVYNQHAYVIHDGVSKLTTLAASPLNPGALADSFGFLREINAIHAAEESWHPVIEQFYADHVAEKAKAQKKLAKKKVAAKRGGADSDSEDPHVAPLPKPQCVTCIVLKPNTFSKWRNKQIEWRMPWNVWYRPWQDSTIELLGASLKSHVKLHSHQEEALRSVYRHGHAGSGMVVLPCGSGKTLTGISLACKLNRATLVLCNTLTSVAQWQAAFRQFCNYSSKELKMGVFSTKHPVPIDCNLVFTTYSILSCDRGMSTKSNQGRMVVELKKWGLVLLDEVHVVPTKTFVTALGKIKVKCAVGLTATPLREDGKISDLPYLVGPMTFYEEEEWGRLTREGFLAKVECVEVRCAFEASFKAEYDKIRGRQVKGVKKELIATINPTKLQCCQALMLFHESQGDKVLIFCDTLFTLQYMEKEFNRPMIAGNTREDAKIDILNSFRLSDEGCTILFSRVGDTSIDLPEANVIIEVGAHFGSRCQETQRFGRVSRPKIPHDLAQPGDAQAYFYSLLTDDSDEMKFGMKRKAFLVEKGYDFTTVEGSDIINYHVGEPTLSSTKLCLPDAAAKADLMKQAKAPKTRKAIAAAAAAEAEAAEGGGDA